MAQDFELTPEQFDLLKAYFDKLQQYSYLKVKIVKFHMLSTLVNATSTGRREELSQVNEADIVRTLTLMDELNGNRGLFNFANFCDYLNLFMASKKNLKNKLKTIIKAKRIFFTKSSASHDVDEFISLEDAELISNFLTKFYDAQENNKFFQNQRDQSSVNLDEFLEKLTSHLEEHVFLKKYND